MIVRKDNRTSVGSHLREGASTSTVLAPERHLSAPKPSALGAEFRDKIGDNLTNRPRIFIQTGTGTIAGLFEFIPFFHEPLNSQGGQ